MINSITVKLLLVPLLIGVTFGNSPDFGNKKIISILEEHFNNPKIEHELLGYNFYENKNEIIFQIEILTDKKNVTSAILFGFNAVSIIANNSKTSFTHSVMIIHFQNNLNPIIAKADLSCSKKYFLDGKQTESQWRKNCLSIQVN